MTIFEAFLIERRRMKASQSDIAKRAGLHRNTVSALENGNLDIRLSTVIKIASAMGLNVEIKFRPKDKEGRHAMTELRAKYRTTTPRLPHLGSDPERALETQLTVSGITGWEREYRFHPTRKWPFDFAWPGAMLAVEIDGATWAHGKHTRGSGYEKDCLKNGKPCSWAGA